MYCTIADFSFEKTILATLALVAIHASAQILNLARDINVDRINKPWRPLVTKEIRKQHAYIFDGITIALAFTTAYLVTPFFFAMMFVLAFFAWGFTLFPVRKNAFTHTVWMAITRGYLPAYMVTLSLPIAALQFLWVLAFNPSKDYGDVVGDSIHGIKTIANQYGEGGLKMWMRLMGITFYATLISLIALGMLPERCLTLFMVAPIAYTIPEVLKERPAFSDNNLGYDLFWWGLSLNAVLLAISL